MKRVFVQRQCRVAD